MAKITFPYQAGNGRILRSHASELGTAAQMQRIFTRMQLDFEYADLPGFHYGHDGCLDAPEAMPAGSTIPAFKVSHVCDVMPSVVCRA